MYRLEYVIDGVHARFSHKDPKVLRVMIDNFAVKLHKITWKLFNCGGVCLDSSEEHNKDKGG